MNDELKIMNEDWVECTLGEILIIERGGSPRPIKEFITNDENGVNWIKIADATKSGKYILKTIQKIKPSGLKRSREVFPGDLLLSNSMSFGRPYIMGIKGAIHDGWLVIRDNKYLDKDYLYYALGSPTTFNQFSKKAKGSTVKNLNIVIVSGVTIKVNPLLIQQAIVKKIEQLFSSLDSGISDLKKAQAQLNIYRQAVLKKAFEGELIVKSKKDQLKNITLKIGSGSTPRGGRANYKRSGIPLVRSMNIHFDFIKYKDLAFIDDAQADKLKNVIIKTGDVLLNITGASIGRVNIAPKEFNNGRVNQHVSIVRPIKDMFISIYLKYFLQSPDIQNWIANANYGVTRQALTKSMLENLEIPLPPIQEQHQIVREIESRLSVCDRVEQSINESLIKAKALRQSILIKAFEGKLLSTAEIVECKADKDYEPATVLLEKIRAEKLIKKTTTKKVKPKKKITKKKLPVPAKISKDIQAGVIAKVIKLHTDNPIHLDKLTHVKCEKISHLVEYHLQIPLGRNPVKDAAGPDDYNHLKKVEHRANMAGYFKVVKKEIGHTYITSRNITKAINNLEKKISKDKKQQLDNLINLFLNFDLESAEIIATLYAGWNNLLIDGKTPTDDEIVYESRENWSKRKLGIKRERFYKALEWMRKDEVNLVPTGLGRKVDKPKNKK